MAVRVAEVASPLVVALLVQETHLLPLRHKEIMVERGQVLDHIMVVAVAVGQVLLEQMEQQA